MVQLAGSPDNILQCNESQWAPKTPQKPDVVHLLTLFQLLLHLLYKSTQVHQQEGGRF